LDQLSMASADSPNQIPQQNPPLTPLASATPDPSFYDQASKYTPEALAVVLFLSYVWLRSINHHQLQTKAMKWFIIHIFFLEFVSSAAWVLLALPFRGLLTLTGLDLPIAFGFVCPPLFSIFQKNGYLPSISLQLAEVAVGKSTVETWFFAILGQFAGYGTGVTLLLSVLPNKYRVWIQGPRFISGNKPGMMILGEMGVTFALVFIFFVLRPYLVRTKRPSFLLAFAVLPFIIIGKRLSGPSLNPILAIVTLYLAKGYRSYLYNFVWWLVFVVAPLLGALLASVFLNRITWLRTSVETRTVDLKKD